MDNAVEQRMFRDRHLGLRQLAPGLVKHQLPAIGEVERGFGRRNWRSFSRGYLSSANASVLLSSFHARVEHEGLKYKYPSAGGLYPVQVYIYVRERPDAYGVAGVPAGAYYYDPVGHQLCLMSSGKEIDRDVHVSINRPVFDRSAMMILFAVDLRAIQPRYGAESERMASIEAGMMASLVDKQAHAHGIGICHIGVVAYSPCAVAFCFEPEHRLLHTMLVGNIQASALPPETI